MDVISVGDSTLFGISLIDGLLQANKKTLIITAFLMKTKLKLFM